MAINDYLNRMRDALSASDPAWDVSVGTPEYKILEAVSGELDRINNFSLLSDYHFDIDTKAGIDLDNFVNMFGIYRLLGKRATGVVTFGRATPATTDTPISAGSIVMQPATSGAPNILYQTTTAQTLGSGQLQVQVPIEAINVGTSGNAIAGAINAFGAVAPSGITTVYNNAAVTGGQDVESDSALRARWKATVFRNLAGTADQFLALALDNTSVENATVIGPTVRVREQLQIVTGAVTSALPDVKYAFPVGGEFFGYNIGTADETLGVRYTDYTYNPAIPPVINVVNTALFPNGNIVEFEHEYTPLASRNDPANGVYHKVDIIVAGQVAQSVVEEVTMQTGATYTFNTTSGDAMNNTQWVRVDDTTHPTSGNFFMPLFNAPLMTLPSTIVVGATTYVLGTDYWQIIDTTTLRGSARARDGIEWRTANHPAAGATVQVIYDYNQLIQQIDDQIRAARLVGTDTLVRQAVIVYLTFNLSITYNQTYDPSAEAPNVAAAISAWLATKGYLDNVRVSDLIEMVHQVPSVANVRLTTSAENPTTYGIQRIADNGTTVLNTYTTDIYLNSDQLPALQSVNILLKAINTF